MGQAGSHVAVHVQLDRPHYYSGDTVTGAAVVRVEAPTDIKSITIKITGVESTQWLEQRQTSGESSHQVHDVCYQGKHIIFKHKLPLAGAGTLQPGDYQWPISFQLPPNIPGTFHYEAADRRVKASIEYKIKATVDQEGLFKSDFKKTARFDVLQRNKAAGAQTSGPLVLEKTAAISAWCCFNKGSMALRVGLDTASYLPGDALSIKAQVDNQSTTQVSVVEMKLHQRLHLTADSFLSTANKHVGCVRVATRQQAINGADGCAGRVSEYVGRLDLSRDMEATCLGKKIRSTYELEVTAKTGCCLSEVTIRQPILLNDPQPTAPPTWAVAPPAGWAPQVYPTASFALPAADCYTSGWQQQLPPQAPPVLGIPASSHQPWAAPQQQYYGQPEVQQQYGSPGAMCYVASPLQPDTAQWGSSKASGAECYGQPQAAVMAAGYPPIVTGLPEPTAPGWPQA